MNTCGKTREEIGAAGINFAMICLAVKPDGTVCNCHNIVHHTNAPPQGFAVAEEIRSLKRKLSQLAQMRDEMMIDTPSICFNTLSRRKKVKVMRKVGRLYNSARLDDKLQNISVPWWPLNAPVTFPSALCKELDDCQPFVSHMLQSFADGEVSVSLPTERRGKAGKTKTKVVKVHSIPFSGAFKNVVVDHRNPGVVCYDGKNKSGTLSMTIMGDITDGGVGEFTAAAMGQLINGTLRLMNLQPFREFMIVFLTDGRRFQYFRCIRNEKGGLDFECSSVFEDKKGWQILFGLLRSNPESLGYVNIEAPGFIVGDLLGTGAYSTAIEARRAIGISSSVQHQQQQQQEEETVLPDGYYEHIVTGDGNCIFHVFEHQLQCLNELTANEPYTCEMLRSLVVSHVIDDDRFLLMMEDEHKLDLTHLVGWVNELAIAALAALLQVNVFIYNGTCIEEPILIEAEGNIDALQSMPDRPVLRISFKGKHYYSILSVPADVSSQQQMTTTGKQPVNDDLPVVIKIFEPEHVHMRDHECTILNQLKAHNNVPSVVQSDLTVCDRPALIISPAGMKVLPVKNGEYTNKTHYVKLLQVLEYAHNVSRICHRDVKPQNIFVDTHGRIILSDWSSSAYIGHRVPWAGTEPFYSIQDEEDHLPQPVDDLVALMRSVYIMFSLRDASDKIEAVMQASGLWRGGLKLARALDYEGMRKFFSRL